ncbi:MAG: hypothetical protein QGD94_07515 [Planctomycetia bacterium]|nr:hypothetical protein [Planctomycetia bacterium]
MVGARQWFGNASGKYGVSFDFDLTGGGNITMRAEADNCKNEIAETVGNRKMAGDLNVYTKDKDWSF